MKALAAIVVSVCILARACHQEITYTVVDTGQSMIYNNSRQLTTAPKKGAPFYGQDAFYSSNPPRYRDNGNGTIADLNTGLVWQKTPDFRKRSWAKATKYAKSLKLGGHDDWRLATIKELYSLIQFNGSSTTDPPTPYIDTKFFAFKYPDKSTGARLIDAQYWSSNKYVGTVFGGMGAVFGVNFADGRIKGYGMRARRGGDMKQYVRCVRGNPMYGINKFMDKGDGTIADEATGLMWTKADSGKTMNWRKALAWCEKLKLAGHDDWRLPNAKELQSIVDYTRAPDAKDRTRRGPAIDPIFDITKTESWFLTSTTLLQAPPRLGTGAHAVYVCFGRGLGTMHGKRMNVHGAGAQRSDPKSGDPAKWAGGFGPQGDEIRILNYVRAVRNVEPKTVKLVKPNTTPDKRKSRHPKRPSGNRGRRPPPPPRR